jgi:HPt (histidine-containing phosphotransfer) domain-containing protein
VNFRAHTIAGTAANMGALRMREISKQMEALAKQGQGEQLPALFGDLQHAFAEFKAVTGHPA